VVKKLRPVANYFLHNGENSVRGGDKALRLEKIDHGSKDFVLDDKEDLLRVKEDLLCLKDLDLRIFKASTIRISALQ
jgi:hypothetical protein